MAAVRGQGITLLLGALLLLSLNGLAVNAQSWAATSWTPAHATFYGGTDASGTMGGSCGYGNLYSSGYDTNTAALSVALFNDGLSCGACFLIQCVTSQTSYCYPGKSITVTATNLCPDGSYGGWCNQPNLHFDLAYPMFSTLAQPVGGVIPVQFQRVPCQRNGGIEFTMNGNPYFLLVLVTNVAGGGDVAGLQVKSDSSGWYTMNHNWGQNWELDDHSELAGSELSFLVTLGSGVSQTFTDVVSSGWGFSQAYQCTTNF
ncbi:unnamed protein product [Calypogeia fissa]